MRNMKIVLGVIEQDGEYVLQLRDGGPQIGAAGLVGCFGGKINEGEGAKQAVAREIAEETSLQTEADDWTRIGELTVISDHKLEPVTVHAEAYRITVPASQTITSSEGQLVRIKKDQADPDDERLTPATKALFKELL